MALIKCAECGREISDTAERCPNCGCKTSRGTTVEKAKVLLANYVIVVALMIIGLILFFPSLSELRDHSSYYWSSGRWVHDGETVWAFIKLAMGAGFVVGGIIDMVKIRNQAKYLNVPEVTQKVNPSIETEVVNVACIPAEKRQHGTCEMCKAEGMIADCKIPNQFGDHKLCPKCIRRYDASIL